MSRKTVAALWITGATVPLLLATVFIVGCCVLPFHQIAHKLMPVCHLAASLMRGDVAEHDHDATTPAREKQEPVKRIVTRVTSVFRLAVAAEAMRIAAPSPATAYRSFVTLGAVRCDQDVGLHVLVETFLI
ncbi:MAG TPA: hypothetical protein VHK90_13810 [Thermoanaerobaculia bacterium]|nr:hypothetical protein [Thermoanaerobaculia bacterium]